MHNFLLGSFNGLDLVVRVHDKKVKEGKRLIFPGLCSRPSCSRESARNKEREKGRRKDTGTQVWRNKGALLNSVWLCIPYYKVASSDKDQKTRLYKLPRKQGAIEAIRPKGNPYQKRVLDNRFHHMDMDITRWSTPKSEWLYSLQPKMEKLYTVNKNKTRSRLWLR